MFKQKIEKKRRVFVSVPRFGTGVPFSLGEIIDAKTHNGHYIEAYPGYFLWHKNTHNGKHCDGITSVFRIEIDQCNRLWIVDTGKIGDIQYCPPQLLIFDLRTDKLFHRYKFPPNTYKPASLFITPIIDTRDPPPLGNCLNTKVYISDVTGYGLVVYDSLTDDSWRVEHDTMKNDVRYDNFTILGESFMLQDGIFGMAVTPLSPQHPRRLLFYHGLANNQEIAVPLNVLDNKALWRNPKSNSQAFQVVGSRDQQASAQAIDSRGNIYFGLVSSTAIGSWNYQTPWNGNSSAIITNPQTLQFTSGLKVVKNKQNKEELWISTNRFQKIMAGTLDNNEINFRIQKALVNDLVCN